MHTKQQLFGSAGNPVVRAALHVDLSLPGWPDLSAATDHHVSQWRAWLDEVWAVEAIAGAVEHASPALARQIEAATAEQSMQVRQIRSTVLSLVRYLLRMTGRATPFGLFAGVSAAAVGPRMRVLWGDGHRGFARAGASWLADVIDQLEACRPLRERLPTITNNTVYVRGGRLVVPFQPARSADTGTTEVSVRYTTAVRLVVDAATSPIRWCDLAGKLAAEFPAAGPTTISRLLSDLMDRWVLISSLRAPSTTVDAFKHLMDALTAAGADEVPEVAKLLHDLRKIGADLARHNLASAFAGRSERAEMRLS